MVIDLSSAAFRKDDSGIALSEALITFPLVLLVFSAFVEFGFAMSQWNQTVKALQYGARLAAVSDPLVNDDTFAEVFPTNAASTADVGKAAPNDATISLTCWMGSKNADERDNCVAARINRIVLGGDGVCGPITASPRGMCDLNWRIQPANLMVTYQRSGLGYWGRPDGPVLTMRLEVRDVTFDLPLLGALLGLDQIEVPAHPVTLTTEDLETCSSC
ncbi:MULTISPECIES: TadE/TadG family type IV pilus assembly protein [unclassified Ensifer]|uniref:TadE/TadG family type IV pilus assembly protein n=1 Tax=unclassified Ensifer TaxID=2633371 RepID=UPI0030101233